MKKLISKLALKYAKSVVTPDAVKDWLVNGLTAIAAKAHANPSSQALVERGEKICAALKDGTVSIEELNLICGDLLTQANIDKAFALVEEKVTK